MRNENKPVKLIPKNEGLLENALIKETEHQSQANTDKQIKIILATSGEYQDGTKWEREATEEEKAEFNSWLV